MSPATLVSESAVIQPTPGIVISRRTSSSSTAAAASAFSQRAISPWRASWRRSAHSICSRSGAGSSTASSSYAMLVHLPGGYKPEQVATALSRKVGKLPEALRRTLTWDQGPEMRDWKQVRVDAGIEIYFCDPHAPWQRGSNENTNGLLREYFPKGTDFRDLAESDLDAVADEHNDRPRKRLGFYKPIEKISDLLLQ